MRPDSNANLQLRSRAGATNAEATAKAEATTRAEATTALCWGWWGWGCGGRGRGDAGTHDAGAAILIEYFVILVPTLLYLLCYSFSCSTYCAILTMALSDAGAAAGDQGQAGQEPRHARRAAAQHALLTYCGLRGLQRSMLC